MNLQGKRVLVFGSGKSGIGAADLLEQVGACPVIYDGNEAVDKEAVLHKIEHLKNTEIYAGELPEEVRKSLDLVVLSPRLTVRVTESPADTVDPSSGDTDITYPGFTSGLSDPSSSLYSF